MGGCVNCCIIELWKSINESKEQEDYHLSHIKECIHHANYHLILLLTEECHISKNQEFRLINALLSHQRMLKNGIPVAMFQRYIYQSRPTIFKIVSQLDTFKIYSEIGTMDLILQVLNERTFSWIFQDAKMTKILQRFLLSKNAKLDKNTKALKAHYRAQLIRKIESCYMPPRNISIWKDRRLEANGSIYSCKR